MVSIGERLKEERLRLGFNQTEMAGFAGATKKTHGLYERGERSPTADYLACLSEAGLDVPYVVTGNRSVTYLCEELENHLNPGLIEDFEKNLGNLTLQFEDLKKKYSHPAVKEPGGRYNVFFSFDDSASNAESMKQLEDAIANVETVLQEEGITLSVQQKAKAIAAVCCNCDVGESIAKAKTGS